MSEGDNIPQMRERITELEKQVKGLEKSNTELSFENRTLKAREVFQSKGLDPKQAELFVKNSEGDVTEESVMSFASEYGLEPQATGTTEQETPPEGEGNQSQGGSSEDAGLQSMAGAGSGSGSGGTHESSQDGTVTRQEWIDIRKTDPVRARQLVDNGQVRLREDNPYAVPQ